MANSVSIQGEAFPACPVWWRICLDIFSGGPGAFLLCNEDFLRELARADVCRYPEWTIQN